MKAGLALLTVVVVLACQLIPPFIYNSYGAYVAVLTAIAILVLWRVTKDGIIVGIATLGVVMPCAIIAGCEVKRELHTWTGTTDFEDGMMGSAFAFGAPAGFLAAIWVANFPMTPKLYERVRYTYGYAFVVVGLAFVAQVIHLFGSPLPRNQPADVGVGILGIACAIGFGVAARRTRIANEKRALGTPGHHKGDGWVEVDDAAPLHRPELAGTEAGPVVLTDHVAAQDKGYRDATAVTTATITRGTPEDIRTRARRRSAEMFAIGSSIALMTTLKLLAVGFLCATGVHPRP